MRKVKSIISFAGLVTGILIILSAAYSQGGMNRIGPLKKLTTYKGDEFASFAEFRVQDIVFDKKTGMPQLVGSDPYDVLLNVTTISRVFRYKDSAGKDYTTMMYLRHLEDPILVRETYKEVVTSIKRATDAMTK
tara:strand:+ start:118 stop:519 length:402 start_codon:yes stop_codon:yes gene_type:complete